MAFYPLFLFVLILAVYRIFRPGKIQDRLSFLSLFLFLVLTFAVHPRIRGSYRWLALLEDELLLLRDLDVEDVVLHSERLDALLE